MRAALLLLLATTACSEIAGLGGYGDAAPIGSGGAGVGGSTSGTGGMGQAVAAADWSSSLEVVYRFDDPDWLLDSGAGGEQPLSDATDMAADFDVDAIPQGDGALHVQSLAASTEASGPPFERSATDSLTFGAWMKADTGVGGGARPLGIPGVYTLRRRATEPTVRCVFTNEMSGSVTVDATPDDVEAWPQGTWIHTVSRWHGDEGAAFVSDDGVTLGDTTPAGLRPTNDPFLLGNLGTGSPGMLGWIDEVFFTKLALSDEAIERIYACGIDGASCSCNADVPELYADCGRATPNCSELPACDLTSPPTLD